MEWYIALTFFLGGLLVLLFLGFPVAFSFLVMNLVGVFMFMGIPGLNQVALQVYSGLATFSLVPIPLFILMGELMFHSKLADETIDVLDRWLGRLPGRLGLLAASSGVLFAATSGSTMANTALLGTVLLPEMKSRGYSVSMSVGPIVGVGGLAMLIPPSALAVVLASIGRISVGRLLMAGIIPALILGLMFALYIVIQAVRRPDTAPSYQTEETSLSEKIRLSIKYLVPMGFIVFMVVGLIILGVATPTEAAATGALATFLVSLFYGRLTKKMLINSLTGTTKISVMVLMIIAASKTFSGVLAYSGATSGLVALVGEAGLHPLLVLLIMQLIVFFLGMFMECISIMMICLPVFMPISNMLGFDPVWFGVLFLINIEMGQITPPFGMLLFVMKGVAPADVTMQAICWAAVPYIVFDILVMLLVVIWPSLALWLPNMMALG